MPLRIVQPNLSHKVDVEGTVVYLKSMSLGERQSLLLELENSEFVKDGKLVCAPVLAKFIDRIEGDERPVVDVINSLETASDIRALVRAIVKFSTLGETDSKNSPNSSSGDQSAVSTSL